MKSKFNRFLITSITSVLAFSSSAFAVERIKANNLTNLNDAGSWDTLPTSADVAVFNSTFATAGNLGTGGLVSWSGVRIADPANNVVIPNATAGNEVTLGTDGIDMSAATKNLSIQRLRVDANQSWNVASGQSFSVSGTAVRTGVLTLDGAGPFTITKTGAGAANLDTADTAIGNVNWDIQDGVVRAIWNNANAWGTGAITLGGGGIAAGTPFSGSLGNWTWNNNIALTAATSSFIDNQNSITVGDRTLGLSGNITGDGSLSFNNTAADAGMVFNLSGTNNYTGGTTINGGTVAFGAASVPATGVITVNANGAVGGAAYATAQDWLDSGKIVATSTGAVAINANSANDINFSTGGYNSLGLASTGGFTYSGTLTPGSGGYIFGGGRSLTVTSALSAATTLKKVGFGTTIISSDANAYNGATTVNSGELQVLATTTAGAKTGLGAGAISVNPGARLRFKNSGTTNAQSYANPINLDGATLISEDGNMTYGGVLGLTGANTINVVWGDKSATFSNTISGTGSFTKTGPGPMILTAAGSSLASLDVGQGKLVIDSTASLTVVGQYKSSTTSSRGSLEIASGGVLNVASVFSSWGTDMLIDGELHSTGALTFSGGTSTITGAGTAKVGTLTNTNFGTSNINGARFNIGAGGITRPSGTLNLGATTLGASADWSSDAVVALTNATAGTTIDTFDSENATARVIALSGVLSGAGKLVKTGAGTLTLSNAGNSFAGDVTVDTGTLAVNALSGGTNTGLGLATSSRTITVNSSGTLSLVSNNVFGNNAQTPATTAKLIINGGTTTTSAFNVLGDVDLNGAVLTATAGSGPSYQTYEFNGSTVTVGGSTASTISSTAPSDGSMHIAGGKTLTLDVGDVVVGNDLTISAALRDGSNDRIGAGSLIKSGLGTLVLTGSNGYSGDTTVSGGVLAVSGNSIADSGKLVIDGGKVDLTGNENVTTLYFGATQKAGGEWGAPGSGAPNTDSNFSGGGRLFVASGPAGGYSTWASTNAPSPQTAGEDFDSDGVSNGAEYVLGGLASTQDSGKLPKVTVTGTDLVFTFKRLQTSKSPETSVAIEVGTTLASWTSSYTVGNDTSGSTTGVTVTDNGDGFDTVTLTLPKGTDPKKFARLNVTIN
jgi:fibronectin-binding autotransporter adhesin